MACKLHVWDRKSYSIKSSGKASLRVKPGAWTGEHKGGSGKKEKSVDIFPGQIIEIDVTKF